MCLPLLVALIAYGEASAQIEIERPAVGEKNAIGISANLGPNFSQDTYFYGVSAEYNRLLTSKWELGVSVGASWEQVRRANVEHGLAVTLVGGYALTERLSAELGYVKEFAKNGADTNHHWQLANGDNAVGVGASYTLWERARHSLSVSFAIERNLTASETSGSVTLAYGFSF
jgi:hypothetical protein